MGPACMGSEFVACMLVLSNKADLAAPTPPSHCPPAHAGKGRSEFFYSWVPFVAPFAGGAIAGGFYLAVQLMNQSAVP